MPIPSIDTKNAQASGVGASGGYLLSRFSTSGLIQATLTNAIQTSGSFVFGGITFNVGDKNLVANFVHPTYGTGTVWIDQDSWTMRMNHSSVTTNTAVGPLNSSRHTADHFWGKVAIVVGAIGLGIATAGLADAAIAAGAAGVVAAGTTTVQIVTPPILYGTASFAAGGIGLAGGVLDLQNCDPYCPAPMSVSNGDFSSSMGGDSWHDAPYIL